MTILLCGHGVMINMLWKLPFRIQKASILPFALLTGVLWIWRASACPHSPGGVESLKGKRWRMKKLNDGSSCCFFVGHFLQNCRFVPPKKTAASARSESVSSRSLLGYPACQQKHKLLSLFGTNWYLNSNHLWEAQPSFTMTGYPKLETFSKVIFPQKQQKVQLSLKALLSYGEFNRVHIFFLFNWNSYLEERLKPHWSAYSPHNHKSLCHRMVWAQLSRKRSSRHATGGVLVDCRDSR